MNLKRKCGILLHPSSLPGPGGIGSIGREAERLLEIMSEAGLSVWQVLPLTPPACGNSPYSSFSAFAGNHLLIDLEKLVSEGDLPAEAVDQDFNEGSVDFENVIPWKERLLRQSADNFFRIKPKSRLEEFWHFCDHTYWLHDYALFMSLHGHYHGKPWFKWPHDISIRSEAAFESASVSLGPEVGFHKYLQWQFSRQWSGLKQTANNLGIEIIGDLPIFVAMDSADVWCNRGLFLLDQTGHPTEVAGVPPDYFSKTGQLWGNPLYKWEQHAEEGYAWWIARIRQMLGQFDQIRIDHFRGFEAAWHVPASSKTAVKGSWVKGPGIDFFHAVDKALGGLPFIAEDLGVITPEVERLRDDLRLPGMKIMQFAFDSDADNPYLPHNYSPGSVVYTGTHDNNTTRGWLDGLKPEGLARIKAYLGLDGENMLHNLVRAAIMSVSSTAILPMQDILGLGSEARMNMPGMAYGNWGWRCRPHELTSESFSSLKELLIRYGRAADTNKS